MGYLQGLGQAKPVSDFINTAGQYQMQQNQGAYMQAHGAYMQQHANVLQMQTEEAKKQQDFMAQRVDFKLSPFYLSLPEESRPDAEKMFRGYGAIDANGFGTRGDMYKTMDTIGKTKNEFGPLMQPVIDAKTQLAQKAYEKYQKVLASGDEAGAKQAEADFNIARANAEASKGTFLDHMSKLDLVNARYGANQNKVSKVLVDPDNGERYTSMADGRLLDGQGTDVSQEIDTSGLIPEGQGKTPATPTNPNAIYMDQEAILNDPNSTPEQKVVAQRRMDAALKITTAGAALRAESLGTVTTNTPGVYFDRMKKKYMMNTNNGPMELTSEQSRQMNLSYHEDLPVTNIKAMQQNAPSVLFLASEAKKVVQDEIKNLGPLSSRWREFWAGKIGAPDPRFIELKTNLNLLKTKLSQMHVGAQGGIEMVKHFGELVEGGKQSPENMLSALDTIEKYANEVKQKKFSENDGGAAGGSGRDPLGLGL